ncbi:MAG TPA: MmcQ/YjbR family DNA-binding protein [Saprospiraceae bacterium]|nr:MmcQ/YjbR family DNA-binding protein [Saprospiraceae bacterium]
MDIESLRALCKKLPHVTEDIKWGNDLCFSIGGKMFCVTGLQTPPSVSFKVKDDEFDEMSSRKGFEPAPYVARYKWVLVTDMNTMPKKQWEYYIHQSYELVKSKLPKKVLKELQG